MGQYTIVTMFRERGAVDAVMVELRNAGVVMNDQRILDSGDGGVEAELLRRKVDDDHVRLYVRGVEKGYPLLVGTVDEANLQRATDILDKHGPVDMVNDADLTTDDTVDDTVSGDTGTSGIGTDAGVGVSRDMAAGREEVIPIIEEQIAVGKRAVERGGVRVRSYVVETPVEETIRLRDETVHVERRNVIPGRPAVEADFQERTLEVIETDEEAVVAKRARVTEEVIVRKDVAEHEKTITDTVRRTEVDVVNTETNVASDRMTGTERIERTRTDT